LLGLFFHNPGDYRRRYTQQIFLPTSNSATPALPFTAMTALSGAAPSSR
jgi:hypothetical protein